MDKFGTKNTKWVTLTMEGEAFDVDRLKPLFLKKWIMDVL